MVLYFTLDSAAVGALDTRSTGPGFGSHPALSRTALDKPLTHARVPLSSNSITRHRLGRRPNAWRKVMAV